VKGVSLFWRVIDEEHVACSHLVQLRKMYFRDIVVDFRHCRVPPFRAVKKQTCCILCILVCSFFLYIWNLYDTDKPLKKANCNLNCLDMIQLLVYVVFCLN